MKILFFITTALIIFLLPACDKGNNGQKAEKLLPKKVVQLQIRDYDNAGREYSMNEYMFKYDSQNRITKIDDVEDGLTMTYEVTYGNNAVMLYSEVEIEDIEEGIVLKYTTSHTGTLNNGSITKYEMNYEEFVNGQMEDSYYVNAAFTYNSGKIARLVAEYDDEDNYEMDFIWSGDNITEVNQEGYKLVLTYGEEPNNINLDFWFLIADGDEFSGWLAFPDYFGKRCANLPEKITVTDGNEEYDLIYEYTRDSAGYLTRIVYKSEQGIIRDSYDITYEQ